VSEEHHRLLTNPAVLAPLKQAWTDSNPGINGGHEEGGFIMIEPSGDLTVTRWPKGEQNRIYVPPHQKCQIDGRDIVASFHTHPNTGRDHIQEPSETDRRAIRDDPELKARYYIGEFVISWQKIYLVVATGEVREVAKTQMLFEGEVT